MLSDVSQTQSECQALKETALHSVHVDSIAKLVQFGGWGMPVQYSDGIIAEVAAVRAIRQV